MDPGYLKSRELHFINVLKIGDYGQALHILKELIEFDLEINFKVESEEEIEKREKIRLLKSGRVANNFPLLLGDNYREDDSDNSI